MKTATRLGLFPLTVVLTMGAFSLPVMAQRVCVESERDGRIVCGRRVQVDGYPNSNYPNSTYNDYPNSTSNSRRCPGNFDEDFYLTAYPDVASAIRRGNIKSACDHYQRFGRYEGRYPVFNEASYLQKNPDVADAVRRDKIRSGYEHWRKFGRYENRPL